MVMELHQTTNYWNEISTLTGRPWKGPVRNFPRARGVYLANLPTICPILPNTKALLLDYFLINPIEQHHLLKSYLYTSTLNENDNENNSNSLRYQIITEKHYSCVAMIQESGGVAHWITLSSSLNLWKKLVISVLVWKNHHLLNHSFTSQMSALWSSSF